MIIFSFNTNKNDQQCQLKIHTEDMFEYLRDKLTCLRWLFNRNSKWWSCLPRLNLILMLITVLGVVACIAFAVGIGVIASNRKSCYSKTGAAGIPIGSTRLESKQKISSKISRVPIDTCNTPTCVNAAAQIIHDMDETVKPCDDFYKFVCGNFVKNTLIPEHEVSITSFSTIRDQVQEQLRTSIEEPVASHERKHIRLVKNLYNSCMDKEAIEDQGVDSLLAILTKLGGWPVLEGDDWNGDNFSWIQTVYNFREIGFSASYFIDTTISADLKNSTKRIIEADQPSLGIPREFLVEGMNAKILEAYHQYMIDVAVLLGASADVAKRDLTESLEFERKLGGMTLPLGNRRAITLLHNPMTIKEMSTKYPSIPWKEYFNRILGPTINIDDDEVIIVNVPKFVLNFEKLMNSTSARVQANYVMWRAVAASINYLSDAIRERQLEFVTVTSGRASRGSRWKECVELVSNSLTLSVSSLYVKKYFNGDAKKNAVEMVQDIRNKFNEILKKVDWMDDSTRKNALDKAASMSTHIAYPEELLDGEKLEEFYQTLELSGESYLHSMLNLSIFAAEYSISQLRKPIDKKDWKNHGRSALVNAFYSAVENSIQFPAAILQGRFFDNDRPKYMNYGGIGFVIGHEVTHGFDDQGRQFDKHGNLIDWWSPSIEEKYLRKVKCMIYQYANYTDADVSLHLNGIITQGENIADNGGMKVAYLAYNEWVLRNGEEPQLPGLDYTPQQMFWISAANTWCSKYRPETLKLTITTDAHCPAQFRILGSMSNSVDFAKDFQCSLGTKMNPKNKCAVW